MVKVVDLSTWNELAIRLEALNPDRLDELLVALRDIVEAEEELARIAVRERASDQRAE